MTEDNALRLIRYLSTGKSYTIESLMNALELDLPSFHLALNTAKMWGVPIEEGIQTAQIDPSTPYTYQLNHPISLIDERLLKQCIGEDVNYFSSIGSTNQYLLDHIQNLTSGHICTAEHQAQGRGRRGKQWQSPFGGNIYLSMYHALTLELDAFMGINVAIGIATVEALKALGAKEIKVKWPNDVYYQGRKLAGILVENKGKNPQGHIGLVVGMGMNVNNPPKSLDQAWASLTQVFPEIKLDRTQLIITFVKAWKQALAEYENKGMSDFIKRWKEVDQYHNQAVKLLTNGQPEFGVMKGINEQGAALIETSNGIKSYYGSEISLRPDIAESQ